MKRPAVVTASAVFTLLGSLAMIGFFALVSAIMLIAPRQRTLPAEAKTGLAISLVMFGALAMWGIATSVALFRMHNWGRISIIVFSVLLTFIGLISAPAILLTPFAQTLNLTVRVVIAAVYGSFGVLGALWLYYFNRRSIRDAFGGNSSPDNGRPLSISIIGWWLLLGGTGAIVAIPFRMPGSLFVWVVTGWSAGIMYFVLGALNAYVGYGLLRLNPIARVIGIWSLCFGAVNSLVFFAFPGRGARIGRMMTRLSFGARSAPPVYFPPLLFMIATVVIGLAIPLWFLVRRKAAFEQRSGLPLL